MRKPAALLLLTALAIPGVAAAETLTFQPPVANMDNLDHHYIYTWRIDGVTQMGGLMAGNLNQVVTSARLYFDDIKNWDNTANRLFVHLLDDARQDPNYLRAQSGVNNRLYQNVDTTGQPVVDIDDDFSNTHAYGEDGIMLVDNGTKSTPLGVTSTTQYNSAGGTASWMQSQMLSMKDQAIKSFSTTAEKFTYNFTEAQIASLVDYIMNGNDFALALDPDCHFDNDFIKLYIEYGAAQQVVPEPASMLLLGTGLAGLVARRNRRSRR